MQWERTCRNLSITEESRISEKKSARFEGPSGWAELPERGRTIEETTERSETGDRGGDGLSSRIHCSHLFFSSTSGAQRRGRARVGRCERVD